MAAWPRSHEAIRLNIDDVIHEERGRLLQALPKGAKTVCSAGAAGSWYFEWFERNYGPVDLHYGVELYLEEPCQLPSNVVWVKNSVSDMRAVPTSSIDLLFSGQNIEHLFYDDLLGFLTESQRVVKPSGLLCMDSPNRLITQEIGYIQPQHVLEFTAEDGCRLLESAGFEIIATHGILSCVSNGRRYNDVTEIGADVQARRSGALRHPNDAFIWWIVARKSASDVVPDFVEQVEKVVTARFNSLVASRFKKRVGVLKEIEGTHAILEVCASDEGCIFYGPYVPLKAGRFTAHYNAKFLKPGGALTARVASEKGGNIIAERSIYADNIGKWSRIDLDFELDDYTESLETPLFTHWATALVQFGTQIIRK